MATPATIGTHPFGNTNREVTIVGLGGEGVLRTYGQVQAAQAVIHTAIDGGITYFDSAHVYADSELYYGSVWKASPGLRNKIFQASKSASRDKKSAMIDLDNTLRRLHTDYLDLWQIHDVRTENDFNMISGPGGALEAFTAAKSAGKVRLIGVTGHHDPVILTRAVYEWPVDSVMMPVNPIEEILGGFLTSTMPAAMEKNIAVIGMKILGAGHYIQPQWDITPATLVRYALSLDLTVTIVGCSSEKEVRLLSKIGSTFTPLPPKEKDIIDDSFRPYARQLAFYRGVI